MMRKILLLSLACMPLFMMAQVDRMVLIEEWTNASCGPCASQNPAFNQLLDANLDNVVSIKYQWYFPGYDPFQEQNPDEINDMAAFYGVNGVPVAFIDGVEPGPDYGGGVGTWSADYTGGPYGYTQAAIDWAGTQTTPIAMTLTHTLNDDATQVTVDVNVANMGAEDFTMGNGVLQIALLEKEVVFTSAPGSNGELEFTNVMRKMYPDDGGTAVPTIAAGESWDFSITADVPDYIYSVAQLRVAAFVQDLASSDVWQSAITETQVIANAIDANLSENQTIAPVGLCGALITPVVEFTNSGDIEVTHAVVNALINGSVVESMTYTGSLMTGESATITFSEIALTEASTSLVFEIEDVNNGVGIDINALNNSTAAVSYAALSDMSIGTSLMEDNESYGNEYPTTGIVTNGADIASSFLVFSRDELTATAGDPIGGFGESNRSIFVNFYQWNPASAPASGSVIYQKIDLTSAPAPVIQFDRASASYSGDGVSSDRLQVRVSADCGETWDIIWDAQGADLNTATALEAFFTPSAADWATEILDISAYAGSEVNVEFRALSGWGNNLYLDNINILSELVAVEELTEVSEIRLFPNPVKDMMKVDFQLEEASKLQLEIFNAVGQKVQNLGATNFSTGHNQFDVDASELSNGVYFLRMYNNDKELNRRFVVQH